MKALLFGLLALQFVTTNESAYGMNENPSEIKQTLPPTSQAIPETPSLELEGLQN